MKVAILGSSGAMGSFFAEYFVQNGHQVVGSDIRRVKGSHPEFALASSNRKAVRDADVVLVAVPVRETANVVREVSPFLKKGSILVEITSVKARMHAETKKSLATGDVRLLSLHPLFGPSSSPKNFKVCVVGNRRDISAARRLLPDANLIRLGIREHDKMMAYTLSLIHLMNLAFLSAVLKGVGSREFERSVTPTALGQLNLAKAILSQDPTLYSYIEMENPFVVDAISSLIAELETLKLMVRNHETSRFEKSFAALAGDFDEAELKKALKHAYAMSNS